MGDTVNMVDKDGNARAVPTDQVVGAVDQGFRVETQAEGLKRAGDQAVKDVYTSPAGKVAAGAFALARGATFGGSDAALDALSGGAASRDLKNLEDYNPGVSTVGNIVGGLGTGGLGVAKGIAGEGASLVRTAVAHAAEGAVYGAGQGVSELALSDDPLTLEHAASVLSSNMLFGGAIGGGLGTLGKSAELGLQRAKGALDGAADQAGSLAGVPEDIAGLDAKGLRAAKQTELDAIEAARVPQRQALANDINAFRAQLKNDDKLFLATKGIKEAALPDGLEPGTLKIQEIGRTSLEADRSIDRLLRNPIRLAKKPEMALAALEQQQTALEQLSKREGTLRDMFASDTSGTRAAALDKVPAALERNKALQEQIGKLVEEPMSERLTAIQSAQDALAAPAAKKSLAEEMLSGSIMGHVAGAVSGLPIIGPMLGAKAGQLAANLVFGRLGKAAAEGAAKASKAAEAFLSVGKKVAPVAVPVATKVLSGVRYAPADTAKPAKTTTDQEDLAAVFKKRANEIKSQTMYAPDGSTVMRPEARAAMAARLSPIRQHAPLIADRIETHAAKRLEFLSSKLPRRPDVGGIPFGPDHYQPSDMEMRTFARYAHAAEDPAGVEERAAHGFISPEEAETYRTLTPERANAMTQMLLTGGAKMQKSLPYQKRLSMTMLTGVPIDPSMHPAVLSVLQNGFASEPGTQGGTMAPRAQPQFGSVAKTADELSTPAQQRALGSRR